MPEPTNTKSPNPNLTNTMPNFLRDEVAETDYLQTLTEATETLGNAAAWVDDAESPEDREHRVEQLCAEHAEMQRVFVLLIAAGRVDLETLTRGYNLARTLS